MSFKLNARLMGLVLAFVLGVGGAVGLPGQASADGGLLDLNLSGSSDDEAILEINLDAVVEVVDDLGVTGNADAEVTDEEAAVEGDVTVADTEAESDTTVETQVVEDLVGGTDILEPVTDLLGGDDTGDILEPVTDLLGGDGTGDILEPVTDLLGDDDTTDSLDELGLIDLGDGQGGGLVDLDDEGLIDLGDGQDGGLIDVDDLLNGGTDDDGATDDGPSNGNDLLGGDLLEPVTDLLGGDDSGDILDVVTDLLGGDNDDGDLLEPVTDLLGGGETGDILEPVTGLLDGDGDLLNDGIDACLGVEPLDLLVELGAGCEQVQDCETIDVNCLLGDLLAPVIDENGLLDPIVDVCLGVGGLAGADSGEACGAAIGPNDEPCDALLGVDCLIDDVTDILGEDGNITPLDLCLLIDPLDAQALAGAGCDQDPGCGLLNLNCLIDDTLGPITGPGGLLDPILDVCLGLGLVELELGAGCGEIVSPCPPDCPPTCPPDCPPECPPNCPPPCPPFCEPTCPPFCVPTCPPFCGPECPPFCGPECPPFCEPTCPPFCVPECPPFCEPTCPPFCGPECPPFCGPETPEDPGDPTSSTDDDEPVIVLTSGPGTFVPVSLDEPSITLTSGPPGGPLEVTADFVPPTAGSGGLLGMQENESGSASFAGTLLLALLFGLGVRRGLRKVS